MKIATLILALTIVAQAYSQSNFYKQYSSNGYDFGEGIVELPDSSYAITGASSSFMEGPSQVFILKVDSLGNFEWSTSFGGNEIDYGRRIHYIPGEGYVVGGFTNSLGNGSFDICVWKTDESGNLTNTYTFGTTGWEKLHDMEPTSDGGFILLGETNLTNDGQTDIYMVRVDASMNIIWTKQIENDGEDNAFSIKTLQIDTFMVCGFQTNVTNNYRQAWVAQMNIDGNFIWERLVQPEQADFQFNDVEIFLNDRIVAVGKKQLTSSNSNLFATSFSISDGTTYSTELIASNYYEGVAIAKFGAADNFNYATYLTDPATSYGAEDIYFYRYQTMPYYLGNLASIKYEESQKLNQLRTIFNLGNIAVGSNLEVGAGGSSIFIMRMGNNQPLYEVYDNYITSPLVGISTIERTFGKIHPNPTKDRIIVTLNNDVKEELELSITNTIGQEIYKQQLQTLENEINVSDLPSGLYIIQLKGNAYSQAIKFQKI